MLVNRELLLEACSYASAGLGNRGVGQCFQFRDGRVSAFNEDVYASAPIDVGWEGVIVAEALMGALQKHTDPDIDIAWSDKEHGLLLKGSSKRWRVKIPVEQHESLGEWEIDEPEEWTALDPHMLDAITAVQIAADKGKQSTHVTRCIHIAPDYLEATDTRQYARYDLATGVARDVLVLRDSLKEIVPLGVTHMALSRAFLHFHNPRDVRVSVRLSTHMMPDLSSLLEGIEGCPEFPLPGGMKEALDALGIMLGSDAANHSVTVTLKPGWLHCRTESNAGYAEERRPLPAYVGEPISFCVHPKLLAAIVERGKAICAPWHNDQQRMVVQEDSSTYMVVANAPPSDEVGAPE